MRTKMTLEMERDEDYETAEQILKMLNDGSEAREEQPSEEGPGFSDKHQLVLETLRKNPGYARKVVHKRAAKADGSVFTNPNEDGAERSEVGSILWELKRAGFAHNDGNRWYPD